MMLIDRPSPFADEAEWQAFLEGLLRSRRTPQVEDEIAVANRVLAAFSAGDPNPGAAMYRKPADPRAG